MTPRNFPSSDALLNTGSLAMEAYGLAEGMDFGLDSALAYPMYRTGLSEREAEVLKAMTVSLCEVPARPTRVPVSADLEFPERLAFYVCRVQLWMAEMSGEVRYYAGRVWPTIKLGYKELSPMLKTFWAVTWRVMAVVSALMFVFNFLLAAAERGY